HIPTVLSPTILNNEEDSQTQEHRDHYIKTYPVVKMHALLKAVLTILLLPLRLAIIALDIAIMPDIMLGILPIAMLVFAKMVSLINRATRELVPRQHSPSSLLLIYFDFGGYTRVDVATDRRGRNRDRVSPAFIKDARVGPDPFGTFGTFNISAATTTTVTAATIIVTLVTSVTTATTFPIVAVVSIVGFVALVPVVIV
ncbi:hypothetical protein QBC35DRAFT_551748, partial [Podospora australis]